MVIFPSSLEDLNLNIGEQATRIVKFSKYALLKVPEIKAPANNLNAIQFAAIEGTFLSGLSTATPAPEDDRVDLSESLQNYILNMDTLITSSSTYNRSLDQNVSERIFWKWLKEVGAMRYRVATGSESAVADRFTEEDNNTNTGAGDLYDHVVQCIGEIDMQGQNLVSNKNIFKEVYFYFPSQRGTTPKVLFKSLADDNYFADQVIKSDDTVNAEYVLGQSAASPVSGAGLRTRAFYDMDVNLGSLTYNVNGSGANPVWFANRASFGPNAYFTDSIFGVVTNDTIIRTNPIGGATITYKRSRLDGVMLDFTPASYKDIILNPTTLKTLNDYNNSTPAQSFAFNAILVYYDVVDPATNEVKATNLLGVYFINDLIVTGPGASRTETLLKTKQDNSIQQQGNGYGVKLNFKLDASAAQISPLVEVSVNDYNTFSMQLFAEGMAKMIEANRNVEDLTAMNAALRNEIDQLKTLLEQSNTNTFDARISAIEDLLPSIQNSQGLVDLYNEMNDQLKEILQGSTTANLSFVLDLLAEDGLSLELVGTKLRFRNKRQKFFKSTGMTLYSGVNDPAYKRNVIELATFDTLAYHDAGGTQNVAADDIYIFVNDGTKGWKQNQTITINFRDPIDFNGFGIQIFTDSQNKFNNTAGTYQMPVAFIPNSDLIGKKSIEVVCIDEATYKFLVL